jgi:hypothetical protein
MQQPSTIVDYLDALTRELGFDAKLAYRVRKEAEDHLLEAVGETGADWREGQHRAIAKFGHPREIARGYAASSLQRQMRRIGLYSALVLAAIFVVMRERALWYSSVQLATSDRVEALRAVAFPVIRYTFLFALIVGLVNWLYVGSRRAPAALEPLYRRRLNFSLALYAAAIGALFVSVMADAVLTSFRLVEMKPAASALIVVASMLAEITISAALLMQLRRTIRRSQRAAALFRN